MGLFHSKISSNARKQRRHFLKIQRDDNFKIRILESAKLLANHIFKYSRTYIFLYFSSTVYQGATVFVQHQNKRINQEKG